MKKKHIVILVIIGICALGIYLFMLNAQTKLDQLKSLKIENVNIQDVDDGTYQGSYSVFPVIVEVEVTIKNHMITNIDIIKHQNGQGLKAESLIESVIDKQSLDIDAVVGATYSSKVILKAIEDALLKAND